MKPWKEAGITKEQYEIAKTFPGLLHLSLPQIRTLYRNDHSLFHGEAKRMRRQERFLRPFEESLQAMQYPPATMHHCMLRRLHDFYVGDIALNERDTMPMYEGTPESFESNQHLFKKAVADVDQVYAHIRELLAQEVTVGRKTIRLRERLVVSHELMSDDPLELLGLTKSKDRNIAHQARVRLILAQACFEARRDGYEPDKLERFAHNARAWIGGHFFADPEGEHVHIVAELDPKDHYFCKRYEVIPYADPAPESSPTRFVMSAYRQTVPRRRSANGKPLQIFFFLRHKRRMMLKMLDRHIRFSHLMGIGDPIAMMFVVEEEDLRRLVSEVREVIVPCPGMVADMNSTFGHRIGAERLDSRNKRSSKLYEAMKYVARMQDRMVEVQFLPMAGWINAIASHSDVNHAWYKMKRYLASSYPTFFPFERSGVPWHNRLLRKQCIEYSMLDPNQAMPIAA